MNMINLPNRIAKLRTHRYLLRQMMIFEKVLHNRVRRFLRKQYRQIADELDNDYIRIETIIGNNKELFIILVNHYQRVGTQFSEIFMDSFVKSRQKALQDIFWEHYRNWSRMYSAQRVVDISNTTRKRITKIIDRGVADKLTNAEIAKSIYKLSEIESIYRARRIAITETHTMSTKTMSDMAHGESSIEEKEWTATNDERTREWHVTYGDVFADSGEPIRIAMDEQYIVNGEALDFPGDPNGSAENIINDRCVELYFTRSREEE
jgi:hypothetical protein